ncbi:SMI1/KNR4 family protein [Kordia sp.]|uniref:SMI1/KNR4 family protein n=1 Tax=Kordia sp. TaxID=1965332 RepID=UPI003D6BD12A
MEFKISTKYEDLEEGVLENWLAAFENTLKIRLPKDYRNHMLKYNGGFPVGDYVIFDADSAGILVDEDIHVQSFDELDNGESELEEQAEWGGSDLITKGIDIGYSSAGVLIMSLASGEFGSIYHMFSYGEPQKIANSWTEFVSYLIDED